MSPEQKVAWLERLLAESESLRNGAGRAVRRCVYCGHRTRTSRIVAACPSHSDLVDLDHNYSEAA